MFSTKWLRPSSLFTALPVLAMGLLCLAIAVCTPAQPFALGAKPTAPTVGERLAADLTWTQGQRDSRFRHMDRIFPTHIVRHSGPVRSRCLPGLPFPACRQHLTPTCKQSTWQACWCCRDGRIRAERYALGATRRTRWTTFSVTKSITDTLAGRRAADWRDPLSG